MKKLFFTLVFTSVGLTLKAQTVNDIPIKDIDVEYAQIVGSAKFLSTKYKVVFDFGQRSRLFSGNEVVIKDESGKKIEFNSMLDALNFLADHNFEFVNSHSAVVNNQVYYNYILKNKNYKRK